MSVALEDRKRVTTGLKSWLDDVSTYEREFKKWEGRTEKIIKRYRDDNRVSNGNNICKFNILWSNVQTLVAATFARLPKPDVSRRFRDSDPVGRVASLILERAEDFEIQHYPDYFATMRASVNDRFLGGRGTCWVRYEPHFKNPQMPSGVQVSDDIDAPQEELDYECAPVDYVHWKDFGHSVARTWEEVTRVWRRVYMGKEAGEKRFGADVWKLVPMDATPDDALNQDKTRSDDKKDLACIYEGWDKEQKKAVWFSKGVKDFLDEREDPLGLEQFFPCPKPLYATLTSDTLVPIPDFTLYQDQANELDTLADRIDGLVKALKVMGCYDASVPELARLFTEAENGTLVPVKNWMAFAEKQGLVGGISVVDLTPIAKALEEAYKAFEQVKRQVFEVTGISDIVRGETDARETLGAQQLKGQYASLRLKQYQEEVARYATEILQIKAQIMCKKFSPQTLASISAADQLSPQDRQFVPQALALLVGEERMQDPEAKDSPNPLRSFRVEVAADTLVYLDEQTEKQSRVEFLTANGTFLKMAGELMLQLDPMSKSIMLPAIMEMWKFGVVGFKVGKQVEGAIDEAAEKFKQLAQQPPPPPPQDPQLEVAKVKAEAEKEKAQLAVGVAREKAGIEREQMHAERQNDMAALAIDSQRAQMEVQKAHAMPQKPQGRMQ